MSTGSAVKHTPADHIERLRAMASDHGETWDLSDNDRAAIWYALGQLQHNPLLEAAPAMLEALEQLEEIVDGLRFGRIWSRENIEVIQAQLRAKEVIRQAKGE